MRKFILIFVLSCAASLLFCETLENVPYEEELIKIQLNQKLGEQAAEFSHLPIELQALLLDYAKDEELFLKTRIALLKYPNQTEKTFLLYGAEPVFQQILLNYGEVVVPVVYFFYENENSLQETMREAQNQFFQIAAKLQQMINDQPIGLSLQEIKHIEKMDSVQRGWLAVHFIEKEGYDFLGQFAINEQHEVKWIQTERFLENLNAFFAGGIRNLETKYVLNEKLSGEDYFWGAVDIAVIGGTLKLLRAGRVAAKSGRSMSFAARTRMFAPGLLAGGGLVARKVVTYGAVAATAYVVASHPGVLHGMMAEVAKGVGIPPFVLQFFGWFLLLLLLSYPFSGYSKYSFAQLSGD